MLGTYQVTVHFKGGGTEQGVSPVFDSAKGALRFAPRFGAPPSASIQLADALYVRLGAPAAVDAVERLPSGRSVKVVFPTGEVIVGRTKPLPIAGGLWLRPNGDTTQNELLFVPDGAPETITFVEGQPTADAGLPPPPITTDPALQPPPRKASKWDAANKSGSAPPPVKQGSSLNRDPFEAPTVGEFEAFDPSKFKKPT